MQNLWKLMEKLLKWLLFQDTNTFTIVKWFVPLMVLYVCLTTMDLLGYLYLQFCHSRCCLISQKLSPWWGAFIWSCFWPPVINEYKVFWFFYARSQYQGVSRQCKIYSSIPGSWKPIGCIGHSPMSWKHVSINGTMHWFLISSEKEAIYPGSILTVDMQENLEQLIFQISEYLL